MSGVKSPQDHQN